MSSYLVPGSHMDIFLMSLGRTLIVFGGIVLGGPTVGWSQAAQDYEEPPIRYSATMPQDAITRLQVRLATGEVALAGRELVMLRTVLKELGVSVESQTLVFSRTSLQRDRIRPDQPRALYFSDSVYVGWVPGGIIEVAAIDAQLGPVFYTIDFHGERRGSPKIERESDCLRCHGGEFVRDIPALFARSLFIDANGDPLLRFGSQLVDDETPFEQRWGGWYVTGYHGPVAHRGNALAREQGEQLEFAPTAKRPDELSSYFDTTDYLKPTSDVVALLVLEHQMAMQNTLTRAGFAARRMITYQHGLQQALAEPQTDEPAYDSVKSVFASSAQQVVDRLLFRQAAPLPEGIKGHPDFVRTFALGAPRSVAGHALKDLQLGGRLFAQRCSYLIYAESFRALPDALKVRVWDQLGAALSSRDPGDRYAYLPAEEKQRIREILIETHPEAKARWKN